MGDAASIRSRKKEGLPAWEESSSPSSSSRAAGGLSSISSATHASAGAIDRLIQPAAAAAAATRERERERDGEDNAGERRWTGGAGKVAALRRALPGRQRRRPCTGAVQIRISDHRQTVFSKQWLLVNTLVSLYFLFQISPSIFHVCIVA